jgi:hypothetical protein
MREGVERGDARSLLREQSGEVVALSSRQFGGGLASRRGGDRLRIGQARDAERERRSDEPAPLTSAADRC